MLRACDGPETAWWKARNVVVGELSPTRKQSRSGRPVVASGLAVVRSHSDIGHVHPSGPDTAIREICLGATGRITRFSESGGSAGPNHELSQQLEWRNQPRQINDLGWGFSNPFDKHGCGRASSPLFSLAVQETVSTRVPQLPDSMTHKRCRLAVQKTGDYGTGIISVNGLCAFPG